MNKLSRLAAGALIGLLSLAFNAGRTGLALAQQNICGLPDNTPVYALTTDNAIYAFNPRTGRFTRVIRVTGIDGNLIGIDFRVADGDTDIIYGTTDTGNIYTIRLNLSQPIATLVSTLSPKFAGGFQSLMDFNPVANALRLIGSNNQNFAAINSGGNLNQTVPQTALQYVTGDPFFHVDPNITAGAYDKNVAGASRTTFYMIDYDLDTLVTIAGRNARGSSDTATGLLKTIGLIVDPNGNPINFAPNASLDIYTTNEGKNVAVAISGQTLYCVDLSSVNPDLPVGDVRKVVATPVQQVPQPQSLVDPSVVTGGFIDVAVSPFPANTADLAVTATDSPDPVNAGTTLTYKIDVINRGTAEAIGVVLSGKQTFGVEFISVIPAQGSCTPTGSTFSCKLDALAGGATTRVKAIIRPALIARSNFDIATSFSVSSDVTILISATIYQL